MAEENNASALEPIEPIDNQLLDKLEAAAKPVRDKAAHDYFDRRATLRVLPQSPDTGTDGEDFGNFVVRPRDLDVFRRPPALDKLE